jgi:hypothetical protein
LLREGRQNYSGRLPLLRILMMLMPAQDGFAAEGEDIPRLRRFIEPFYVFRDAGIEVVIASPEGGFPAVDFPQDGQGNPEAVRRFSSDRAAREALTDTIRLDQAFAEDFDAAFCIGHPGAIWRDPNSAGALIAALLKSSKPVAVIPSNFDLTPRGVGSGLLIVGDLATTPVLVALALLGALGDTSTAKERESS